MKSYDNNIAVQIELHSVEGIKKCFSNGIASPNDYYNGKPLIYELIGGYPRSAHFKECIQVFVDFGVVFEDAVLLSVLLDNAILLDELLTKQPELVSKRYTLSCAYTPFFDVSLLHICAEFNHLACAEVLVKYGLSVDAKAGIDDNGFGGQTPIFHTVNQNLNASEEMLHFLLRHSPDLQITVKGLVWGDGCDWETFIPAVNPISYAMMGLLPQFHREEQTISNIVSLLLKHAYNLDYSPKNVPCKYLAND